MATGTIDVADPDVALTGAVGPERDSPAVGRKAGAFSPRVEDRKGAGWFPEAPVSETRRSCKRVSGVLKTSLVPRIETCSGSPGRKAAWPRP